MQYLIEFESDRLGYGKVELLNPHHSGIPYGLTAIIGRNGAGKTTLGRVLEKGRYAYGNRLKFSAPGMKVKMISFTDIHALSGMEAQYFAQRMESTMNDMVPSVRDILRDKINSPLFSKFCDSMNLKNVADKKINFLSSGELRKLIIINALLDSPDLMILDNPYIGLDAPSRSELNETFRLLRDMGKGIVLLVCNFSEIPDFADHYIRIENKIIGIPSKFPEDNADIPHFADESIVLPDRIVSGISDFDIAFKITDGHISYGNLKILSKFNWTVKKGERWILTGPNGSGKSLLLSMICADNPQGYANDITLFDMERGKGESIWEIKDNIGYVSPEMQLFFKSNSNVRDIIIQGMRSSLNRYVKPSDEEIAIAGQWMNVMGIQNIADRLFQNLSDGEQRLVHVARALIKQPQLLVLDEPLHGLDAVNKQMVMRIINQMASKNNMTMIFVTHYTDETPDCITNKMTLQSNK